MPDYSHTAAYRAVFGAVRNVEHAHPAWCVHLTLTRAVAAAHKAGDERLVKEVSDEQRTGSTANSSD